MTTSTRAEANRRNARRSTGPRTEGGKARVARNALRHGLAVPVAALPEYDEELRRLAALIAGADATAAQREAARRVAEPAVDLERISAVKLTLLARLAALTTGEKGAAASDAEEVIAQLVRVDRYERRALSRWKSAVRGLVELRATE